MDCKGSKLQCERAKGCCSVMQRTRKGCSLKETSALKAFTLEVVRTNIKKKTPKETKTKGKCLHSYSGMSDWSNNSFHQTKKKIGKSLQGSGRRETNLKCFKVKATLKHPNSVLSGSAPCQNSSDCSFASQSCSEVLTKAKGDSEETGFLQQVECSKADNLQG